MRDKKNDDRLFQERLNPIKREKLGKRAELIKMGWDPYPHHWPRKRSTSLSLIKNFERLERKGEGESPRQTFYIAGRLMRKRDMGKTAFFNIQDGEGILQCYIRQDDFPREDKERKLGNLMKLERKREKAIAENIKYSQILEDLKHQKTLLDQKMAEGSKADRERSKWNEEIKTAQDKLQQSEKSMREIDEEIKEQLAGKKEPLKQDTADRAPADNKFSAGQDGSQHTLRATLFSVDNNTSTGQKGERAEETSEKKSPLVIPLQAGIHLREKTVEKIEISLENENLSEVETVKEPNPWALWKLCDMGDIVGLGGWMFRTKKGEVSLRVQSLDILCKSVEALPEKYHGLEDKELKYRYRHLDLIMNPSSRAVFKIRSQIIYEIRAFMNERGFMEVETPVLQPLYGGAVAVPFETHSRRLGQKMYLKISPEIYLKKLIVGGFEKVFEIGKNFRNEGIDRTHSPEFTMMEYYQAYTDYEDQMRQFESLVSHIAKKIKGSLKFEYQGKELDFSPPWERISLRSAVKKFGGIDPDKAGLRELVYRLKELDPKTDVRKFESALRAKLPLSVEEDLKDEVLAMIFELSAEKKFWNPVFVTDFPLSLSPLTKQRRGENPLRLAERFEPYIAGMEMGNAYTELNDPVIQRQRLEGQKRWQAVSGDSPVENSDPSMEAVPPVDSPGPSLLAEKGDDAVVGRGKNFSALAKGIAGKTKERGKSERDFFDDHSPAPVDQNFLHALEVGMPPTGGVGLGIERLVMILSNQKNIRDSILFPVLRNRD